MLISVVIPVYDGGRFLAECLSSIADQDNENFEVIVNDDPRSNDDAEGVVKEMRDKGMNVRYLRKNTSIALGRKEGAAVANGELIVHLDVDMQMSRGLLGECVALIESGYDALVIPEESYGISFWARCRWLERKCYTGVEPLEALRCIKSDIYRELGGHNPEMVYFEDKDFDLRVRRQGYKVGSTVNLIYHNEGDLSLRVILRKRVGYARSAVIAVRYYPEEIRLRGSLLYRYRLFFNNRSLFAADPILGLGTVFMKTCEFIVSGWYFHTARRQSRVPLEGGSGGPF